MTGVGRSGGRIVVVIASMDGEQPHVRELTRDRYVADSIGQALDAHAPDPAPGGRWEVEYVGRARSVGAESELTSRGQNET